MRASTAVCVMALAVFGLASSAAAAQGWTMYPEAGADYTVLRDGAVYMQFGIDAWGPNWRYFGLRGQEEADEGGRRTVAMKGTIGGTDRPLNMVHTAARTAADTVVLQYELSAPQSSDLTQIVVRLEPSGRFFSGRKCIATMADGQQNEVSMPFGRGRIGTEVSKLLLKDKNGEAVELTVDPAREVSSGGPARIQLVGNSIQAGAKLSTGITVRLPGSVEFVPDVESSLQRDDTSNWFPYPVGPEGVPIDLSFLNKDEDGNYVPAGSHGFVELRDGDFVFEDGTPARFWGLNVTAGAALGSPERAEQLAERLARLGVNVIRLHHLDSWANPIIDYDHPDGTTQHLDPESMRALDKTVYELKRHGIYVILDPWVQRCFKEADGVADYGHLGQRGNFNLHPFIYFDDRMQELIQKQWRQVWTHENEFTGLAYKDDPACAMTEVINEGLMISLGGVRGYPHYVNEVKELYQEWARENDGQPWDQANVLSQNYGNNNIDFMRYLQRTYYRESHVFLRSIGLRMPINATNWAHFKWVMVPQTILDFMDHHHYYGGNQIGPGSGMGGLWLNHPPGLPGGPFGKPAGFAVPGKPVASSECGNNPPKTYRAAYQVGLGAVAAFQGWDSITGYAYSQSGRPGDTLGAFEWETDPASVASVAMGSLVYRRGDVRRARETAVMDLPQEEIYRLRYEDGGAKLYWNTAGFQSAIEKHRVLVTLPEHDPQDYHPVEVLDVEGAYNYRQADTELRSDTGELWRDWDLGVGTIDTPRTQVAYGRLGETGKAWETADCRFEISTPFAVTALQSLTEDPIAVSGRLLLTAAARAQNTGMTFNMARTKIVEIGGPPVIAEPVEGTIIFRTSADGLLLRPVRADGTHGPAVRVPVRNGIATVELKDDYQTIFYVIEAAG